MLGLTLIFLFLEPNPTVCRSAKREINGTEEELLRTVSATCSETSPSSGMLHCGKFISPVFCKSRTKELRFLHIC